MKVYQKLASSTDARLTCIKRNNTEWKEKHEETIEEIVKNKLPSGSGIDNGNKFNFEKSNGDKIVIDSAFHVLDENGMYDGWIDYNVTVKPSLIHDITLDIRGNFGKRQDVKEMLYEVYRTELEKSI